MKLVGEKSGLCTGTVQWSGFSSHTRTQNKVDSYFVTRREDVEPRMRGRLILGIVRFTLWRGEKVLSQFCLETWFNPVTDIWYTREISVWNTLRFVFTGEFKSYCYILITRNNQESLRTGVAVSLKGTQRGGSISRIIRGFILTGATISGSLVCSSFSTLCYSHLRFKRRRFTFSGCLEEIRTFTVLFER